LDVGNLKSLFARIRKEDARQKGKFTEGKSEISLQSANHLANKFFSLNHSLILNT
jgi:hypothetical protein